MDQKATEEAPQSGRGANRNARKKPYPDRGVARIFQGVASCEEGQLEREHQELHN
jgi:hypothetical protein